MRENDRGHSSITKEPTGELIARLNMSLPIDSGEIPDFKSWVNFNGFTPGHRGYDFAAYLTANGKVILGLPADTNVRASADGIVYNVFVHRGERGYDNIFYIKHEKGAGGLVLSTGYCHVLPSVREGEEVKKGDIVGTPYRQEGGNIGPLVHLHFVLMRGMEIDPRAIDASLYWYNMIPPETPKFIIPELPQRTSFVVAHFPRVDVGLENKFFRSKKRIRT